MLISSSSTTHEYHTFSNAIAYSVAPDAPDAVLKIRAVSGCPLMSYCNPNARYTTA